MSDDKTLEDFDQLHGVKFWQKRLEVEVSALKKENKELRDQLLNESGLRGILSSAAEVDLNFTPDWATRKAGLRTRGAPCLFLSDIHGDEFIDPAQVGGLNAYGREIMDKRLEYLFDKSVHIFKSLPGADYKGAYILLGGDNVPGYIHEELRQSSEAPVLVSVLHLAEKLGQGIKYYADNFSEVVVCCVVGNHGRIDRKPRKKNKVHDNFDWLLYRILANGFRDDPRVVFKIPLSADCSEVVYGQRFLLTHGDQFRGGSGISGFHTPLELGAARKQRRHVSIDEPFQVLICGHFHQEIQTAHKMVNGSLSGYDEFAFDCNFPYDRPKQLTWVFHPEHGLIHRNAILVDSYKGGRKF